MNGRLIVGIFVAMGAVVAVTTHLVGSARSAPSPALLPLTAQSADGDPFPLDGRLRIYETRQGRLGEGMLLYESRAVGRQPLSDGHEYVVVETCVRPRGAPTARVVSRDWYRREAGALLCARRQEGPVVVDLVPAQTVLELPLVVGERWSWSGLAGGRPSRLECVVASCERVTVGAGTFENAWRIDSEVHSDNEADEVRRSLWIQPGTGVIEERSVIRTDLRTLQLDAALERLERN